MSGTLLFCFPRKGPEDPQFGPLLQAAGILARGHHLEVHLLVPGGSGWDRYAHGATAGAPEGIRVHVLPPRKGNVARFGFEGAPLKALLRSVRPDYVWIHAEFWEGAALQFLAHYRFRRPPKIVAYAATNHIPGARRLLSPVPPFLSRARLMQRLLWPRLDGVAARARRAMLCARRMGLPGRVPVTINFLPVAGPHQADGQAVRLPWPRAESFIVGFAGALNEQKGWKVLLRAMELLPERFKAVLVGDGPDRGELLDWLKRSGLRERVCYAGALTKERLLATYPLFHVLVLPSITTPRRVEQFGCVLAEAMACGVPVVGSDSGAIPETVGEAGLIVPERDPAALAEAVRRMCEDGELRRRCVEMGRMKYRTKYSPEAYARSMAGLFGLGQEAAGRPAASTGPNRLPEKRSAAYG